MKHHTKLGIAALIGFICGMNVYSIRAYLISVLKGLHTFGDKRQSESQNRAVATTRYISLSDAIDMTGLRPSTIIAGLESDDIEPESLDGSGVYPIDDVTALRMHLRATKLREFDSVMEVREQWGV